jgi:hypothetical protein
MRFHCCVDLNCDLLGFVTPCSLLGGYQRFEGTYRLHVQGNMDIYRVISFATIYLCRNIFAFAINEQQNECDILLYPDIRMQLLFQHLPDTCPSVYFPDSCQSVCPLPTAKTSKRIPISNHCLCVSTSCIHCGICQSQM